MQIFLNIFFLILGLVLLIKGADFFVSGASAVAKKLKVPTLVIGLTVVAIGTSLPELAVSISSAIKGVTDLSVGNIIGSNMFNTFVCLGVLAIIAPVSVKKSTKNIDFVFLILLTGLLLLFSVDKYFNGASENIISRTEGIILVGLLIFYMTTTIVNTNKQRNYFKEEAPQKVLVKQSKTSTKNKKSNITAETSNTNNKKGKAKKTSTPVTTTQEQPEKQLKVWQIILCLTFGLAGVVFGGECVSSTSQFLATKMGMSEALVGITIVAIGTSLPELVTSVVAAKKGENDLALGNIIGSNIMNIALILGTVSVIGQISVSFAVLTDLIILLCTTIIFTIICLTREDLKRAEGIILVLIYISYMTFAIVRNYCF